MSVTISSAPTAATNATSLATSVSTELIAAVDAARAAVAAGPVGVGAAAEAAQLIETAEQLRRLAAVCATDALTEIDRSAAYRDHGHATARTMVKHHSKSSGADAHRLDQISRMCRQAEHIAGAWRAGNLSLDRAAILARAFANPRVRDRFCAQQEWFLARIGRGTTRRFERMVARWVSLADSDGSPPQPETAHRNRDVALVQDHFSRAWTLRGTLGSLQGSKLRRILDAYIQAEFLADWAGAESEHGDQTHRGLLGRTDAQRRADALEQIFADAINNPNRSAPIETVHNIVWSAESVEELLARFAGADPAPIDPDTHRCNSIDGSDLDETTAFADLLVSRFRSVVQNRAWTVVGLSSPQRLFTGLARLGVILTADTCYWPGCDIPTTACEIDHLRPAARGGLTDQQNGKPACRHHNRTKERGFIVTRAPDGRINIVAPNGDTISEE